MYGLYTPAFNFSIILPLFSFARLDCQLWHYDYVCLNVCPFVTRNYFLSLFSSLFCSFCSIFVLYLPAITPIRPPARAPSSLLCSHSVVLNGIKDTKQKEIFFSHKMWCNAANNAEEALSFINKYNLIKLEILWEFKFCFWVVLVKWMLLRFLFCLIYFLFAFIYLRNQRRKSQLVIKQLWMSGLENKGYSNGLVVAINDGLSLWTL